MNQNLFKELASLVPVQLDAGQVFTGMPTGKAVKGYEKACSYTPSVDPRYIFHESARDVVVWFMHDLDPLYLYGPTGCGKTTLIKQLAARLNYAKASLHRSLWNLPLPDLKNGCFVFIGKRVNLMWN